MNAMEMGGWITGIGHIGIAVRDIEIACEQYMQLGFRKANTGIISEESRHIKALLMHNGSYTIELLAPIEEGMPSPVDTFMQPKSYAMYHVCYLTSDLDAQIAYMKEQKYILVDEPRQSTVIGGRRAVFMLNRKMGLIELAEE